MGIGIGMLVDLVRAQAQIAAARTDTTASACTPSRRASSSRRLPAGLVGVEQWPADGSAAKSLRSGIMLLLVGIVLFFAIDEAGGSEGALFGLIPAAVGIANLVYAAMLLEARKKTTPEVARAMPRSAIALRSRSETSAARTLSGAAASSCW